MEPLYASLPDFIFGFTPPVTHRTYGAADFRQRAPVNSIALVGPGGGPPPPLGCARFGVSETRYNRPLISRPA